MTQHSYKYLNVITAFFAVILVLSNVASSAKIVDMGISVFGIRLAFDGGTLLFPFAYILGDVLTEVYGFRVARRVIWTGFACLVLSSALFFILQALPSDSDWESYAGTSAYEAILGGMSMGGIVLASLTAYLFGEFSNSVILSKIKVKFKGSFLFVRTIGSSLVGQMLDTLIFVSIACAMGVFGWELFATLVLTNYILKVAFEVLLTPGTYLTVNFLKKHEGIDTYDDGVKYRLI